MIKADASGLAMAPVSRERVEEVIRVHVLPYMHNHGGDLHVVNVTPDGTVICRLDAACLGCPSAAVTVVAVVERALQVHISADIRVMTPQLEVSPYVVNRIRELFLRPVGA